jgi:RHS repeat-associated protein
VRWSASSGGTYAVSGRFEGIDTGGTTTDVLITKNGTTLFTGVINGYGNQLPFSLPVTVAAGDIMEFSVGYGANGSYNSDSTGLAVTITGGGAGGGSSETVHWLVTDHLGTPRMIIDQSGTLATIKRHDYLPFGEELFAGTGGRSATNGYGCPPDQQNCTGDKVRQQFTSQERDVETGLDYFGARYYASTQGRFSSPDPLLGSGKPASPQSWNRYAYVGNNPLAYIDPDGMLAVSADDDLEQQPQQQQQSPQAPAAPASSAPAPQVPTGVTVNAPQPNTMVNIPIAGKLFTGVGTLLELTVMDQNGDAIPNVTVMESVTPRTTTQNQDPVTSPNGTITDLVGRGVGTSDPVTRQEAANIIRPILTTPTTMTQDHRLTIMSPANPGVMAVATHQRTLTNVDSQGNLRPYVNPATGRSMNNFSISVSSVTVTRIPTVMCPRVF